MRENQAYLSPEPLPIAATTRPNGIVEENPEIGRPEADSYIAVGWYMTAKADVRRSS